MNKKYFIVTAIVGGVSLFAYSIYRYIKIQKDLLEKFTYKILSFGITTTTTQTIKGNLKILFNSDAEVEITIKEFVVDFYLNGVKVGYIEDMGVETLVPAKSSSIIYFNYTLNPQLVFSNLAELISLSLQQEGNQFFEIKGYATIKSGFLKVSLPIEYETSLNEILSS